MGAHCWLLWNLFLTSTLNAFYLELLSPVLLQGIVPPCVQDSTFALLEFHETPLPHLSSLASTHCMAEQPDEMSATPPSLSANWLRVHSLPSFRSLMKLLNKTRPSLDPCGTPQPPGLHLDSALLITSFSALCFSWFSAHHISMRSHCPLLQHNPPCSCFPLQRACSGELLHKPLLW